MPYHDFESVPNDFFKKIEKKNYSNWEKIEKKKEIELKNFLKECSTNNKEFLQNITPKQHNMIHKN